MGNDLDTLKGCWREIEHLRNIFHEQRELRIERDRQLAAQAPVMAAVKAWANFVDKHNNTDLDEETEAQMHELFNAITAAHAELDKATEGQGDG